MLVLLCVQVMQTNRKNLVEEEKKQLSNVDKQKIGKFVEKTRNFLFKKIN
jgi:hypothetical protein